MGFISDIDALKFGKQYLSDEEYAKFPERMMRIGTSMTALRPIHQATFAGMPTRPKT